MNTSLIIAIDGPAASGKGTLARRIADYYHLRHLDTGLTYRAVAHMMLREGWPLDDRRHMPSKPPGRSISATSTIMGCPPMPSRMPRRRWLSFPRCGASWSTSSVPSPNQQGGAVLDGRDVGTVVCPDAEVKLYVTASAEVRAMRRLRDIEGRGGKADHAEILADIERRDERDMGRADSPLKPAADAHLLDTSEMSIEAAFQAARAIVDDAIARRDKA